MTKSFSQFLTEGVWSTLSEDVKMYSHLYELTELAILDDAYLEKFANTFNNAKRKRSSRYQFELDSESTWADTYYSMRDVKFSSADGGDTHVSIEETDGYDGIHNIVGTILSMTLANKVVVSFELEDYAPGYDEPAEEPGDTFVSIDLRKAPNADLDETIGLLRSFATSARKYSKCPIITEAKKPLDPLFDCDGQEVHVGDVVVYLYEVGDSVRLGIDVVKEIARAGGNMVAKLRDYDYRGRTSTKIRKINMPVSDIPNVLKNNELSSSKDAVMLDCAGKEVNIGDTVVVANKMWKYISTVEVTDIKKSGRFLVVETQDKRYGAVTSTTINIYKLDKSDILK